MLQKSKMVKRAREAIELLYEAKCKIIEHRKIRKPDKSTVFEEVVVHEDEPCRISFKNINATSHTDNMASLVKQSISLFIRPEIDILPGSKIIVEQNDVINEYKCSGKAAVYATHQELILDIWDRWT